MSRPKNTFRVIHTWTDSEGRENSEFETYTHTHDATSALRAFIDEHVAGGDSDIKGVITIEIINKRS